MLCCLKTLPLYNLVCLAFPLVPLSKIIVGWKSLLSCVAHALMFVAGMLAGMLAFVVVVPLAIVVSPLAGVGLAYRFPARALHPLDAGPHIFIAFAASVLYALHLTRILSQVSVVALL